MSKFRCHVTTKHMCEHDDLAECIHIALVSGIESIGGKSIGGTRFLCIDVNRDGEYIAEQHYQITYAIRHSGTELVVKKTRKAETFFGMSALGVGTYESLPKPLTHENPFIIAQMLADDFFTRYIPRRLLAT
jgi:hypothetical protein